MPTHVALLRGINVGRSTRIAMADLRSVVADLGHTEVATYLQSGTVVLSPADGGRDHLTVVGRTTYLCTPDGLDRSRLAQRLTRLRRPGEDPSTARNWRTVEAVARLLEG